MASDAGDWKPVPVGADGAAVAALSALVAVGSGGVTLLWAWWVVARTARRVAADAGPCGHVAVLGHRLDPLGQPTPAFRRRLRRGWAMAARHGAVLHVLGGVTRPGCPSEGAVGRAWLLRQGVPPGRVVAEERSQHTLENLRALRASLPASAGPVALVTCRHHAARAGLMAEAMGLGHALCAAERRYAPAMAMGREAVLLHWHQTGWWLARVGRIGWLRQRIG